MERAGGSPKPEPGERVTAAVLIASFTAVAVLYRRYSPAFDADTHVFERVITLMHREGLGFYEAARSALVETSAMLGFRSAPPELYAVRMPTLFVVLSAFPLAWVRWLLALPLGASLALSWTLARPWGRHGALAATLVVAASLIGPARWWYLHPELWGLPLFLGGVQALRTGRPWLAAPLLGLAAAVREHYGVALVAGFLIAATSARRRDGRWPGVRWLAPWAAAGAGALAVAAGHYLFWAQRATDPEGTMSRLASDIRPLAAISPGANPVAYVVGVATTALGLAGLWRHRHHDDGSRLARWHVSVLAPLAVWSARPYWALTWIPVLATFLPAGWQVAYEHGRRALRRRSPDRA